MLGRPEPDAALSRLQADLLSRVPAFIKKKARTEKIRVLFSRIGKTARPRPRRRISAFRFEKCRSHFHFKALFFQRRAKVRPDPQNALQGHFEAFPHVCPFSGLFLPFRTRKRPCPPAGIRKAARKAALEPFLKLAYFFFTKWYPEKHLLSFRARFMGMFRLITSPST